MKPIDQVSSFSSETEKLKTSSIQFSWVSEMMIPNVLFVFAQEVDGIFRRVYSCPVTVLHQGNTRALKWEAAAASGFSGVTTFTHVLPDEAQQAKRLPQVSKGLRCLFLMAAHGFLALFNAWEILRRWNPWSSNLKTFFSASWTSNTSFRHHTGVCGGSCFLCWVLLQQEIGVTGEPAELFRSW